MERAPFGQDEDAEKKPAEKKKKPAGSFLTLLRKLSRDNEESSLEKHEEEPTPKSRFRELFKNLFSKWVSPIEARSELSTDQHDRESSSLFEQPTDKTLVELAEDTMSPDEYDVSLFRNDSGKKKSAGEVDEEAEGEFTGFTIKEDALDTGVADETEPQYAQTEAAHQDVPNSEAFVPPLQPFIVEQEASAVPTPPETETNLSDDQVRRPIVSGGAVAAGAVAANTLNRYFDNKREKKAATEVDRLQKRVDSMETAHLEQEQKLREQIDRERRLTQTVERMKTAPRAEHRIKVEPIPAHPNIKVELPRRNPTEVTIGPVDKKAETVRRQELYPEQSKHPEANHAAIEYKPKVRPEVVMHRVETAAEQDIPIESYYERRHEVRDSASKTIRKNTASNQGDGSLPSAVYSLPKLPTSTPSVSSSRANTNPGPPPAKVPRGLYTQAVKQGIGGGIVVLLLLLALLLFG